MSPELAQLARKLMRAIDRSLAASRAVAKAMEDLEAAGFEPEFQVEMNVRPKAIIALERQEEKIDPLELAPATAFTRRDATFLKLLKIELDPEES